VKRGFTGPFESGSEQGYATTLMTARRGIDMTTASVSHPLWKVTDRRGIAKGE
jgi:hypothetical protein